MTGHNMSRAAVRNPGSPVAGDAAVMNGVAVVVAVAVVEDDDGGINPVDIFLAFYSLVG